MTGSLAQRSTLRARTRKAMQLEIAEVAIDLFTRQGFEATTTEQIAAEAGVSIRTLFRYFDTKEDIVLDDTIGPGEWVQAALLEVPVEVPPWDALRTAIGTLPLTPDYSPARLLAVSRLCIETPSLRARQLEKQNGWIELLEPKLREHLTPFADGRLVDIRARAIISSALACLQCATEAWVATDGNTDVTELYDQAISAVRQRDAAQ